MLVGNRYTSNIMYGMQFLRNNVIYSNVSFFLFLYVYVRSILHVSNQVIGN